MNILKTPSKTLLRKRFALSIYSYIILTTLLFIFGFNFTTIASKFSSLQNIPDLRFLIGEIFACLAVMALLLSLFGFSKILLKSLIAFIWLGSIVAMFFEISTKIEVDSITIAAAFFESNIDEASSLINYSLIAWVFFFGVLPIVYLLFFVKIKNRLSLKRLFPLTRLPFVLFKAIFINILVAFIFSSTIISLTFFPEITKSKVLKNTLVDYRPINYIGYLVQVIDMAKSTRIPPAELVDISKQNKFSFTNKLENQELTIVLVIGESARADHYSLNGYKRKTNPILEKTPNITSFTNVNACGTLTRVSVPCLLSHRNRTEFSFPITETNLISAFKSLGFYVSYLSPHGLKDSSDNAFYVSSYHADRKVFNHNIRRQLKDNTNQLHDGYLLPYYYEDLKKNNKHNLIILHTIGSHFRYEDRYPEEFTVFKNDCRGDINCVPSIKYLEKTINTYDNTIVFNDYFLSKVIEKVKDKNSIVYFVADHGQYLGEENGRFLHSGAYEKAGKPLLNVPQIIYVSDKLKKTMGQKYQNMVDNKNADLSHDNVFHSLFDCLSISSDIVDKKLSICN